MHWHRAALRKLLPVHMVVGLGLVVWFWGIQLTLKSIGGDSRGGCINSMSDALPDWGGDVC